MKQTRQRIPLVRPIVGPQEKLFVKDALDSGWVSSIGKYVEEFERQFAAFCGVRYAVSTSNGTTAIHLALRALGVGPQDEVLIPDLTFIAVANAVRYQNAVPVPVDCVPGNWCIDPQCAADKITN